MQRESGGQVFAWAWSKKTRGAEHCPRVTRPPPLLKVP